MSKVDYIPELVENELKTFQKHFRASLHSKIPFLDIVAHYIIKHKGSQIRSKVVFLCAKLSGKIQDQTYSAASIIELLHSATLIHKDVSDEPYKQINHFSINSLWSSKIAVLMGDYLLAKGLLLAVQTKTYELLEIISQTIKEMNEVEIKISHLNPYECISSETYFALICQKSALLISVCAEAGVKSVNAAQNQTELLRQFGYNLGIALQIKDDLLEINSKSVFRRNKRKLLSYKFNLAFIYALENSGSLEKENILNLLNSGKSANIKKVKDYVQTKKGVILATNMLNNYKINAIKLLDEFPETPIKQQLINFIEIELNILGRN